MTASEFWPNKEDIDQYHCSLTNARNTKRADWAKMKELSCLRTPYSCIIFSVASCQSRTSLEMRNAMTSVLWLEKTCSPLRHLGVTVSNHSPVLSPDICPPITTAMLSPTIGSNICVQSCLLAGYASAREYLYICAYAMEIFGRVWEMCF